MTEYSKAISSIRSLNDYDNYYYYCLCTCSAQALSLPFYAVLRHHFIDYRLMNSLAFFLSFAATFEHYYFKLTSATLSLLLIIAVAAAIITAIVTNFFFSFLSLLYNRRHPGERCAHWSLLPLYKLTSGKSTHGFSWLVIKVRLLLLIFSFSLLSFYFPDTDSAVC